MRRLIENLRLYKAEFVLSALAGLGVFATLKWAGAVCLIYSALVNAL